MRYIIKFHIVEKIFALCLLTIFLQPIAAQNEEAFTVKSIYDKALTEGRAYDWLRHLTKEVGPRLSGSPGAAAAVVSMQRLMDTLGFDTVYLQPCTVPRWERGAPATASIVGR